jgi:hypothetical protein
MNNIELILQNEIKDALTKRPISFVVMNNKTMKELLSHPFLIDTGRLKYYHGYQVLVSEDLLDNEFKIG